MKDLAWIQNEVEIDKEFLIAGGYDTKISELVYLEKLEIYNEILRKIKRAIKDNALLEK